jgi:hypothetical protein
MVKLAQKGVDYTGTNMWVVPSLLEARKNLPARAPERKVLTRIMASLERKEKVAEGIRLRR